MKNVNTPVVYDFRSYVATITLACPDKGNVVNNYVLNLLYKYINKSINDNNCRVIVVKGKDGIFSRGMDFSYLLNNKASASSEIKLDFSTPYKEVIKLIHSSPKPVVSYVDGEVLAGGMGIMLASDIIISTKRSIFGLSEVLFGIIPAYVFPLLIERIPLKKARYLVISSKKINGNKAYEFGIVDELVEDNLGERALKDCLKRLLASSPEAINTAKRFTNSLLSLNLDNSLDLAQKQLTKLLNEKENIEAIRSFIDGGKPAWSVKYSTRNKEG